MNTLPEKKTADIKAEMLKIDALISQAISAVKNKQDAIIDNNIERKSYHSSFTGGAFVGLSSPFETDIETNTLNTLNSISSKISPEELDDDVKKFLSIIIYNRFFLDNQLGDQGSNQLPSLDELIANV